MKTKEIRKTLKFRTKFSSFHKNFHAMILVKEIM
jgi:hypothetical protein